MPPSSSRSRRPARRCRGDRPTPKPKPAPPELFQKAEAYYRNHFNARALATFHQAIEADPKGPYADGALYKIAGIHLREERYDEAVVFFQRLQSEFPRSRFADESLYNMGFCYHKQGDPERALGIYREYLALSSARNKNRARVLAGEALADLGRYEESLIEYALAGAEEKDRDRRIELLHKVRDVVDGRVAPGQLKEIAPKLTDGIVSDYVRYRAAQDAVAAGDKERAKALLAGIDYRRARYRYYREAEELRADLGEGVAVTGLEDTGAVSESAAPLTIGVVLPLSGRFDVYGEQVLHGVMLAVDRFGKEGITVEAVIRDSEADGETAAAKVDELAAQDRVMAVVGPLLVKEAVPAADAAERANIPMLTLSRKEDFVAERGWVFRGAVTFTHQARALIRYAEQYLGARRFGVMHPRNEFGEAFKNAFQRELDPTRHALEVVASYSDEDTDFRAPAHSLNAAGELDAVFLPDKAGRVALIAPQLVYFGVKKTHLLGPSSWNEDDLAEKAGPYLQRAAIVDGFFAYAKDRAVRDFVGAYQDAYAEQPTLLAALGYDAVAMIAKAAEGGGADSRAALRRSLLQTRGFKGVAGTTTFLENGGSRQTALPPPRRRIRHRGNGIVGPLDYSDARSRTRSQAATASGVSACLSA
ncbi:MAG: penicillin-binding protein activator [Deltaproteobacteria bacterium]|nr:penicillin-binding protein activator [Deltaproteobacteria bacterium]